MKEKKDTVTVSVDEHRFNSNFRTFPLADDYEHEPHSNEAIPSPDDVKEAKDWVDFNEK